MIKICTSPLTRVETNNKYINKKGGISYAAFFGEKNKTYPNARKVQKIACGQCMECRLNKARDKANQLMLEKKNWTEDTCWFITLTYSDEWLPTHTSVNKETGEKIEGISLSKKDAQNFIKKLRRHYEYHNQLIGIRYFLCGEYGSQFGRPHYHLIVFNLPLDQKQLVTYKDENGNRIWKHAELQKIWNKGFVSVGRVTWESCCYVARYITKKQYGKTAEWYYSSQGKIPEFTLQSKKPPLGQKFLEEHIEELLYTDKIPIANKKTAELIKPPKSMDYQIKKKYPNYMRNTVQERRQRNAEEANKIKMQQTNMTEDEYLNNKEQKIKEKFKNMRKEI